MTTGIKRSRVKEWRDSLMKLIEQLVNEYIAEQVGWAPTTQYSVKSNLNKILKFIDNDPEKLTGPSLFMMLRKNEYKPYTMKNYFQLISQFEQVKLGTNKVAKFLEKHKAVFRHAYQDKTKVITDELFNKMLTDATSVDIYNALLLMGRGGLRRDEMLNIKWTDFFTDEILTVKGKGGKIRQIPFLKNTLKQSQSEKIITTLSAMKTYRHMKQYGYSPHDLRAYFATRIANTPGLNLKDAALVLGHSSINTTQRYVRSDFNRVKGIMLGGSNNGNEIH